MSLRAASGEVNRDPRELPQNHHDDRSLPSSAELVEAIEVTVRVRVTVSSLVALGLRLRFGLGVGPLTSANP